MRSCRRRRLESVHEGRRNGKMYGKRAAPQLADRRCPEQRCARAVFHNHKTMIGLSVIVYNGTPFPFLFPAPASLAIHHHHHPGTHWRTRQPRHAHEPDVALHCAASIPAPSPPCRPLPRLLWLLLLHGVCCCAAHPQGGVAMKKRRPGSRRPSCPWCERARRACVRVCVCVYAPARVVASTRESSCTV